MGILDSILGSESSAEFRKETTKTPTQTKALDELVALLSGEVGGFEMDPGLTERGAGTQAGLDELFGMLTSGGQALKGAFEFDQPGIEELFRTTVRDPLVADVRENIIPELSARYGSQFFSSERQAAEGGAIEDLMQTLAGEKQKLVQGERQRQLQALGLIPGLTGAGLEFGERGDISETRRKQAFSERQQLINSLLGGTGQDVFENIGVVTPGKEGVLSSFLGGVGSGYGKKLAS